MKNISKILGEYFDSDFYINNYKLTDNINDPLEHYIKYGWKLGNKPNEFFDPKRYIDLYLANDPLNREPLLHSIVFKKYDLFLESQLCSEEYQRQIIESYFDPVFYKKQINDISLEISCVQHYISYGCDLGLDPHPSFSTTSYLKKYGDNIPKNINPYYHWIRHGRLLGFVAELSFWPECELSHIEEFVKDRFDVLFYLDTYKDVKESYWNPLVHYMRVGWREGRNPSKDFNTLDFVLNNPAVLLSGENPFYVYCRDFGHSPCADSVSTIKKYLSDRIYHAYQDVTLPIKITRSKRLAVFIVPEHNEMSGGIYSIFSIANQVSKTKKIHGYDVVLMTRPNKSDVTYCRQKNFKNSQDVYRFQQIVRFSQLETVYIHVPEYACSSFIENIDPETFSFLMSVKNRYVNVLNQNIELMVKSSALDKLRSFATDYITQSVAHHAYANQNIADIYNINTLLLAAYTDLSEYEPTAYHSKDNLIIYSKDNAPYKDKVLSKLRNAFSNFEFVEINKITFDEFMELAARAKFSISFGEGFDGYVSQPILMGGLGLTLFKPQFFPSRDYLKFDVFFKTPDEMEKNIVNVIKQYIANPDCYEKLNKKLVQMHDELYSVDAYKLQISRLMSRSYDYSPGGVHLSISR